MKKLLLASSLAAICFSGMANAGTSEVILVRESAFVGGAVDVRVEVDGVEVCKIPNGETCKFTTTDGVKQFELYNKTLWGTKNDPNNVTLKLEDGKAYQFSVGPRNFGFTAAFGVVGMIIDAARDQAENWEGQQTGMFRMKAIGIGDIGNTDVIVPETKEEVKEGEVKDVVNEVQQ